MATRPEPNSNTSLCSLAYYVYKLSSAEKFNFIYCFFISYTVFDNLMLYLIYVFDGFFYHVDETLSPSFQWSDSLGMLLLTSLECA